MKKKKQQKKKTKTKNKQFNLHVWCSNVACYANIASQKVKRTGFESDKSLHKYYSALLVRERKCGSRPVY